METPSETTSDYNGSDWKVPMKTGFFGGSAFEDHRYRPGIGDMLEELVSKEKSEGLKFDQGKARLALVPPSLEIAVGEILTLGAEKYAPNNWKKGIAYSRVVSA
jgi:hypothetical protein